MITHVCLIGDDPSANLTPIIDDHVPSDKVIVAHKPSQKNDFLHLRQVIKTRGYLAESWLLPDSLNTLDIKNSFEHLFEQKILADEEVWLNASNGSHYQLLAAYEVARSHQCAIYVVEPRYDKLCWLYPANKPAVDIKDCIKLHEFLLVNDCRVRSDKTRDNSPSSLRALANTWCKKAPKLKSALAKLNYLAQFTRGPRFTGKMQALGMLDDQAFQWLLTSMEKDNLIEVNGKDVHFENEETRFFANGGWLEELVFDKLQTLKSEIPQIQDIGKSLEVERGAGEQQILNELDVVALVNNKLYVIECKTKKFERGDGTKTLYKIDSISQRLGGLKCSAALVTFYPLSKAEYARANELGIRVLDISKNTNIHGQMRNWIEQELTAAR